MNLADLPEHIQKAIRGVRVVTAASLGKITKGPNGRNCCRWCLVEVPKGRQSWCSDDCVNKLLALQACPQKIYDRDQGRCQACGCDITLLEQERNRVRDIWRTAAAKKRFLEQAQRYLDVLTGETKTRKLNEVARLQSEFNEALRVLNEEMVRYPKWFTNQRTESQKRWSRYMEGGTLDFPRMKEQNAYEIDHIVRVADGGATVMDNLRLLCVDCHNATRGPR